MGKTELWALGQGPAGLVRGGPLKIGVIGVGVMGSNHARVLSEMAGVTLVGVVDPDRTQRELSGAIWVVRCSRISTRWSRAASRR